MKHSEIANLLPAVFLRALWPGSPFLALLEVMERFHAPSEATLASLAHYFHPYLAPDAFVPFLASWVDLEWLLRHSPDTDDQGDAAAHGQFPPGLGRLRELVAAAAYLFRWRGTNQGLTCFLETATGVAGFVIDEHIPGPDGRTQPFHIRIHAPQEAIPYHSLIERIIELEKPAYVTHELTFEAE